MFANERTNNSVRSLIVSLPSDSRAPIHPARIRRKRPHLNNARGRPVLVVPPSRTGSPANDRPPQRSDEFLPRRSSRSSFHLKSLRRVRWAVLRYNPVLHPHPAQRGRTLPSLLEPGDTSINLGPLLWTLPGVALELTWDRGFSVV